MTTQATTAPALRVRFVYDEDAHFEECNGAARPLTRAEYKGNEYRACPRHPRAGTKVLSKGGKGRKQVQGCAVCGNTRYRKIPYAEYLQYYGNPDRHVYIRVEVERQCPCCHGWTYVGGVGGIDMMDDSSDLVSINPGDWLTPEQVRALPDGYLKECALEDLSEAGGVVNG